MYYVEVKTTVTCNKSYKSQNIALNSKACKIFSLRVYKILPTILYRILKFTIRIKNIYFLSRLISFNSYLGLSHYEQFAVCKGHGTFHLTEMLSATVSSVIGSHAPA